MGDMKEVCRFCGRRKENAKGFYKTVGKPPFCDMIYFCDVCKATLEKANWFKDRKVEDAK